MKYVNCYCDDCKYNEYGSCKAQDVDIDMKYTPSGDYPICSSYEEKEDSEDE